MTHHMNTIDTSESLNRNDRSNGARETTTTTPSTTTTASTTTKTTTISGCNNDSCGNARISSTEVKSLPGIRFHADFVTTNDRLPNTTTVDDTTVTTALTTQRLFLSPGSDGQ